MARLNICGEETGGSSEYIATSGTFSVQTTTKRTGSYALQINISGAAGYVEVAGLAADGTAANLGRTVATYYRRYIRFTTLPSANAVIASVVSSAGSSVVDVKLNNSGTLTLVGATTSATIATLTTDTWYRLELKVVSNGTSEARIDGGTAQTCTANNVTQDRFRNGTSVAATYNAFYDDLAIDDAAYPGAGQVNILKPNATGTYSRWANGAGTSPTNVAEVPNDGDTSYIYDGTGSNIHVVNMDSAATGGVSGAIACVKPVIIVRGTAGSQTTRIYFGDGSNWYLATTSSVILGTTYTALASVYNTSPVTSATWTSGGVDAIQLGPYSSSTSGGDQRCTAIYAMVESAGTTIVTLDLTTAAAVSTTNTKDAASDAAISRTATKDIASDAALSAPATKDVATDAATTAPATKDVTTAAATTAPATLDLAQAAVVTTTNTKDVAEDAAVSTTGTKDVGTDASISTGTVVTLDLATAAAAQTTNTKDVATDAAVQTTNTKDVAADAATTAPATKDVASDATVSANTVKDVAVAGVIAVETMLTTTVLDRYPEEGDDDGEWSQDYDLFSAGFGQSQIGKNALGRVNFFGRFPSVNVNQGETVEAATLSLFSDAAQSAAVSFRIYAVAEDNAVAPTSRADAIGRTLTSASVAWTPGSWGANVYVASPDISSVIQEVVNRAGWIVGNGILLYVMDDGSSVGNIRTFRMSEVGQALAPKLDLTFLAVGHTGSVEIRTQSVLSTTNTKDVTDDAALATTNTKDVASDAVIDILTVSLNVAADSAISTTATKDVAEDAAVSQTVTLDLAEAAAVCTTVSVDVTTAGVLATTGTKDVAADASVAPPTIALVACDAAISGRVSADLACEACIVPAGAGHPVAGSAELANVGAGTALLERIGVGSASISPKPGGTASIKPLGRGTASIPRRDSGTARYTRPGGSA